MFRYWFLWSSYVSFPVSSYLWGWIHACLEKMMKREGYGKRLDLAWMWSVLPEWLDQRESPSRPICQSCPVLTPCLFIVYRVPPPLTFGNITFSLVWLGVCGEGEDNEIQALGLEAVSIDSLKANRWDQIISCQLPISNNASSEARSPLNCLVL